jgi:predicted MPP superfamily phosphohydrolase
VNALSSTIQECLGLGVFVFVVGTTFALFTVVSLRLVISRARKKSLPEPSKYEKCVLAVGFFGCLCVLYGLFIEPYWLEITHVRLATAKLRQGSCIRIAHISDIHSDPVKRLEDTLPEAIAKEKPDIIVFTGDAINSPDGLSNFRECLTKIAKIAPTYVVKGNWDSWYFRSLERFKGTGAVELEGTPMLAEVRNQHIWLTGLPIGSRASLESTVAGTPDGEYRVFCFHYPDFVAAASKCKIDLVLSGHTHGGQIALPFYGAIITLAQTGKQYESGLHQFNGTYIYTNRGIGMEGGKAPRVRFCARPELTIIDIVGAAK